MELSIIVTSYRNAQLLKLCLDSVRKNVADAEYELIVADSATDEDTAMMMREEYPGVKFFPFHENVGFQALVRSGIEAGSGRFLLLLNGDIIVTPGAVQELLAFMKNNPEVGMAGPGLLNFNGSLQYSCFRFYKPITIPLRRLPSPFDRLPFVRKHLDWFLMRDYDRTAPRGVDWLMGSAMLLRRDAVDKIGLMDPRFFMYMEDVDWCRRFWIGGWRVVYYPMARMYHYHGKGSAKGGFFRSLFLNRLTRIHIRSAVKYFQKYHGKPLPNVH